jgi:hypothetical protein
MNKLAILGWIMGGILVVYSVIPRSFVPGVIRIACDDSRMPGIAAHLSYLLQTEGVAFQAVPRNEPGDVTIDFVESMGMRAAGGAGIAGDIVIVDSTSPDELYLITIHEILHTAGVPHEPNDQSSVMHTHSKPYGRLKRNHVEALRTLPGTTAGGFLINYIKARFG